MLESAPLHHLRHKVRSGLAPFYLRAHLLRPLVEPRNEMMFSGKLQNCAPDESAGAILPTKNDIILRHVARQADDIGVSPPAALVKQQPISEHIGEGGNAARAET